jgi:hypothetical protein
MNKVKCVSISNNNGPIDIMPPTTKRNKESSSSSLPSFPMIGLHTRDSSHSTASTVASDYTTEGFGEDIIISVTTTSKQKKNVSFSASNSVGRTLSRNDITTEEKRATWYYSAEYDQITRRRSKEIQRIERGEILKDIKYCARGLEYYTRRAFQLKQKNRQAAYMAVLLDCRHGHHQQQNTTNWRGMIQQEDDDDDHRISDRYHSVSSSCQLWASTVGLRDQIAAEDYLFDVECC